MHFFSFSGIDSVPAMPKTNVFFPEVGLLLSRFCTFHFSWLDKNFHPPQFLMHLQAFWQKKWNIQLIKGSLRSLKNILYCLLRSIAMAILNCSPQVLPVGGDSHISRVRFLLRLLQRYAGLLQPSPPGRLRLPGQHCPRPGGGRYAVYQFTPIFLGFVVNETHPVLFKALQCLLSIPF